MRVQELREMSLEGLQLEIDNLQQELFNLRFRVGTRQLADTSRIRQVRRDIARSKTVLRERELQAEG